MSDPNENESTGQDVPVAMEEDPQVNEEAASDDSTHSLLAEETPNLLDNGNALPETQTDSKTALDDKNLDSQTIPEQPNQDSPPSVPLQTEQELAEPDVKPTIDAKTESNELRRNESSPISIVKTDQPSTETKPEASEVPESKTGIADDNLVASHDEPATPQPASSLMKSESENAGDVKDKVIEDDVATPAKNGNSTMNRSFLFDDHYSYGSESGTEEDQSNFMKELENFFRERSMEFKPPKFYGEGLNCLKLWRAVTRLGGYDKVTSCKLWRQVGESFKPPKTCTTVSWTFRGFYEKALLDYERHKTQGGELNIPIVTHSEPMSIENPDLRSGRARRDAAARAMQGWHSQRLLGNGEVSDPIIKDKKSLSLQKREKQLKNIGLLKRKKPSYMEQEVKAARSKAIVVSKPQLDIAVVDIGPPADWVKINVQRTKDCFEVYALVPGLLREEVRVQSDPAGRLVISGEPEHPDNPWGVTPFKKVVSLPSRIDPHQTSAVVTLHGQLFVRVPFEQSE